MRNKEPVPLEIICYHCQQSSEKMLKGYLAFNGEAIRKTHDLVLLNRICQTYDASFQNIANDSLHLTDYGVNVRYPFSMEIEEADMVAAILSARQIEKFVLVQLGLA